MGACPSQTCYFGSGKRGGEMSVALVLLVTERQKVNPFPEVEGHGPAGSDTAGFSNCGSHI